MIYRIVHTTHRKVLIRVDVIDTDGGAGVTPLLGAGEDWFQFSHQRIDPRQYTEIQSGQAKLSVFLKGSKALRNDIVNSREGRFRFELYIDNQKKWVGTVLPDLCVYTENVPEKFTIVAKDFTLLKSSFFALEDERELVIDTIRKILNPLGYSIPYVTSTSWTNANMNDAQDFLRQTYHETRAFRVFGDIDSEITREEALKWILRNYGLTLKQWGGFRLDQFTAQGASVFRAVYGASGSPSSEGVVGASHTVDKITIGSSNQALPGVKRVINTFNHRSQSSINDFIPETVFLTLQKRTEQFQLEVLPDQGGKIRFSALVEVDTADTITDTASGGEVGIELRQGQYYWGSQGWTTTPVLFFTPLIRSTNNRWSCVISIETDEIPSDATRPIRIKLFSADLALYFSRNTTYGQIAFEVTAENSSESIQYLLEQNETFTEEINYPTTYFGDGPLISSPSALRYALGDSFVTGGDWQRRGGGDTRSLHSNLLHEILDGRRGARRLLNADIIGDFQPENPLDYDGALFYYTGGTLDGQTGRWSAQVVVIQVLDLEEQIAELIDEILRSNFDGSSQVTNLTFLDLRRLFGLVRAVGVTTVDYDNEQTETLESDLNVPMRSGIEYWVLNAQQLTSGDINAGVYAVVPKDLNGERVRYGGGEVTVDIEEQVIDAPKGSLIVRAPAQEEANDDQSEEKDEEFEERIGDLNTELELLEIELEDLEAALETLNDVTLPALQSELDDLEIDLNTLTTVTLPALQSDLNDADSAINTLNTVTIPALQSDLNDADSAINTLNTVTLPALQSDLNDAESAINTLNTVTIPELQSDLNTLETVTLPALQQELDDVLPITETKISNDAISAPKLQANSVVAGKIAANAVVANSIAAGSIIASKIATNAVTANAIEANAITADKIQAGAVVAGKIGANAVTANSIAADAVTANKIEAGAVIAGKIGANAVTANTIEANAVTANKIQAGAVVAGKIGANAVTANEIAAGSIIAEKIAAGAIIADKIGASAVTAVKIATNAVTANKIQAGAVITAKLSAEAVTAEKINVNDLAANNIFVGALMARTLTITSDGKITNTGGNFEINQNGFSVFGFTSDVTTTESKAYKILNAGGTNWEGALADVGSRITLRSRVLPVEVKSGSRIVLIADGSDIDLQAEQDIDLEAERNIKLEAEDFIRMIFDDGNANIRFNSATNSGTDGRPEAGRIELNVNGQTRIIKLFGI